MNVHLTRYSRNSKTGPIPVSTSPASTCPDSCAFKRSGCYAENYPMRFHWSAVSKGTRGGSWPVFCDRIKRLPRRQLWRHNQAGDLPGCGKVIDAVALLELVRANKGRRGFTFTHKPMTPENQALVYMANGSGFTINLSADNLAHADELAALEVGPVVVALAEYQYKPTVTPEGRPVIICPATLSEHVNCDNCELCQKLARPIIGFPAHGARKALVTKIATQEEV
jgi:hypothetical protein